MANYKKLIKNLLGISKVFQCDIYAFEGILKKLLNFFMTLAISKSAFISKSASFFMRQMGQHFTILT